MFVPGDFTETDRISMTAADVAGDAAGVPKDGAAGEEDKLQALKGERDGGVVRRRGV